MGLIKVFKEIGKSLGHEVKPLLRTHPDGAWYLLHNYPGWYVYMVFRRPEGPLMGSFSALDPEISGQPRLRVVVGMPQGEGCWIEIGPQAGQKEALEAIRVLSAMQPHIPGAEAAIEKLRGWFGLEKAVS